MTIAAPVSSETVRTAYRTPRYSPRVSKRGLSDAQIERVRSAMRAHRDARCGGNATKLATALGISQSAVSQILSGQTRPAYGTAAALAADMEVPVESILSTPRERAAEIARDGGLPASAIAAAMAEEDDGTRSVLWWIDRMRAHAALSAPSTARGAA